MKRFSGLVQAELEQLAGKKMTLVIEITQTAPSGKEKTEEKTADTRNEGKIPANTKAEPAAVVEKSKEKKTKNAQLREDFTFDNYVIGENNNFAGTAAMAISRNPGTTNYNPLFIYGGVGLGKTHLIQAIGNHIHEHSDTKIIYIPAETFTNEFIEAIKEKGMASFKRKYRHVDVLLIDDIHFFQKQPQVQEELFNTYNTLLSAKKQMVFTCDRPISELKDFTERLRTRLGSGLPVDIQMPPFETRCAILRKRAESTSVVIPNDVIELICKNISSNTRDLVAALNKLTGYAELVGKPVTIELAQQQLKDMFSSPKQANLSIDIIMRIVAEYFSLSPNDLKSKKRSQNIVHPRQLAMYIIHEFTEFSTTEIGNSFGNRDHSTVTHSLQQIEKRKLSDPNEESTIQALTRLIKENSIK
jgi:chromosomal replication initiator protein